MADWPYSTARWQRLRKLKLSSEPLCEGCKPHRLTPASHVDHVRAISDGGAPFPGLDGLRSYCQPCHSAKTARGVEAGAVRSSKPRKGCDVNGLPLDPNHPWIGESTNGNRQRLRVDDRALDVFQSGLRNGVRTSMVRRGADRARSTLVQPEEIGRDGDSEGIKSLRADRVGPPPALKTQLVHQTRQEAERDGR